MFGSRSKNRFKKLTRVSSSSPKDRTVTINSTPLRFNRRQRRSIIYTIFSVLGFLGGLVLINVISNYDFIGTGDSEASGGTVSGVLKKWHTITVDFEGPNLSEVQSDPNPFLDYRLQVEFSAPSGEIYNIPGFFAGDGNGGGSGNVWRVRFTPSESGIWDYEASFRSGNDVAIDLSAEAGVADSFDGATGSFTISALDTSAPGFRSMGRLEYVGGHYMKFADGSYWLKGGIDSPENFMGYKGFDNTVDQGGIVSNFLHEYPSHVADFVNGDPLFTNEENTYDSKGIIGALNYLSSQKVNSIYFLPMNLGGDGQETYPFVSPQDKTHYDISKLEQWHTVFEHAIDKGIALHMVLSEQEAGNQAWLDGGTLGVERKLYYRELIARFGHALALKWNISEENRFDTPKTIQFAEYINTLDPYKHQIGVHTHPNDFTQYEEIKGNQYFSATSIQYDMSLASSQVEEWRQKSTDAGRPWVIDMDENTPAGVGLTNGNAVELRKRALYDIYFSGGNLEWYFGYHDLPLGGDMRTEDFRTREEMYKYMWYARNFMEQNLPFWEMQPADNLVNGENTSTGSAQVFIKPGSIYAVYFPSSNNSGDLNNGTIDLSGATDSFKMKWYDPRTGQFAGSESTINGGSTITIPAAPSEHGNDWVLLITDESYIPGPGPGPGPAPIGDPAYISEDGLLVIEAENLDLSNGWSLETDIQDFIGTGYIHWIGGNFFATPGNGIIEIPIYLDSAGTYNLRLRNYHNHPDPSEENDVWVKFDNTVFVKTYSSANNEWTWNTSYEFSETDKVPASNQLTAGAHTLYFSGRSNGFRIDRIHLYLDSVTNPLDTTHPQSEFGIPDGGGTGGVSCEVTAQVECNYDLDDAPALNVAWEIDSENLEFGATAQDARAVIRADLTDDPWFTVGSDVWWSTYNSEFTESQKSYTDADWNFNIEPDKSYSVWVTVYPQNSETELCVTDFLPISCEPPEDPPDDPPEPPEDPPDPPEDPPDPPEDPPEIPPQEEPPEEEEPPVVIPEPPAPPVIVPPTPINNDLPQASLTTVERNVVIGVLLLLTGYIVLKLPIIKSRILRTRSVMKDNL